MVFFDDLHQNWVIFPWGGSWRLALSAVRKVSFGLQQVTCVFASIFGIISICRNKRECCTTTQSLFKIRNVSCWWFFTFDIHFKGKSGPDHFETLKNGFQSSWRWALSAARKFSIGLQQVICMFASFFGIISIRGNKRECCTTPQSDFKIPNVSCWWFFSFDTHFKGKSGPDHFET